MEVSSVDPTVVRCWVSPPFDEVLLLSAMSAFTNDFLYFKLFFSINHFGRRLRIDFAVFFCFMKRGQKINMKHISDSKRWWEFDAIYQ